MPNWIDQSVTVSKRQKVISSLSLAFLKLIMMTNELYCLGVFINFQRGIFDFPRINKEKERVSCVKFYRLPFILQIISYT